MTETHDFAASIKLTEGLIVSEYVGYNRSVRKIIRKGTPVLVTYYHGGRNCGIKLYRMDKSLSGRDLVASPKEVLAATGIDPRR